jgi:hypothetical protein
MNPGISPLFYDHPTLKNYRDYSPLADRSADIDMNMWVMHMLVLAVAGNLVAAWNWGG